MAAVRYSPPSRKPPKDYAYKGSDGTWQTMVPMPGPKAPASSPFPTTLGKDPSKGQYRIPGLGEWGKRTNVRKARENTPFNPGLNPQNKRWT